MNANLSSLGTAATPREYAAKGQALVSVIIPALNEERVIGRCLESLQQMDFPREMFEVIVVDNGSTDGTIEIARTFASSYELKILQMRGGHISALRNLGASHARGEILAFLDADCLVPREWLAYATARLTSENAGVIGGYYRIPDRSSWVARTWYPDEDVNKRGVVPYVPSGDLIVMRSMFSRVGGFDETLETNEDYEFCQRIRGAAFSVLSFPELNVIHLGVPQTALHFYRRNRWHGKHVVKVFLRDISSLHNAKPVFFASYMLLCLAGTAAGIALGAFGHFRLLTLSLLATVIGPCLLGLRAAVSRRRLSSVFALSALYMLYGIARARCLLDIRNWMGERRGPLV